MRHYSAHGCEAAVLATEEANRPLCAQEIEESIRQRLPETCQEAKTRRNDYSRVLLSLQLSILKHLANSPKAFSRLPVFYGLRDVEYDTDNWTLIDRGHKSEEEFGEAWERELAPTPITEHPDQCVSGSLISGMSCDQALGFVVNIGREPIFRILFCSIQQQMLPGIIQFAYEIAHENRQQAEPDTRIAINSSWDHTGNAGMYIFDVTDCWSRRVVDLENVLKKTNFCDGNFDASSNDMEVAGFKGLLP
jgi:hypothetical protein